MKAGTPTAHTASFRRVAPSKRNVLYGSLRIPSHSFTQNNKHEHAAHQMSVSQRTRRRNHAERFASRRRFKRMPETKKGTSDSCPQRSHAKTGRKSHTNKKHTHTYTHTYTHTQTHTQTRNHKAHTKHTQSAHTQTHTQTLWSAATTRHENLPRCECWS